MKCPRVEARMECPECGYPLSEAALPLDKRVPHVGTVNEWVEVVKALSEEKLCYDVTELFTDEELGENTDMSPIEFIDWIARKYNLTYASEIML